MYHPGITSLGASCFGSCKSLSTVNLPSVAIIGASAFAYCSSLKTISLPAVTSITGYAFYNCSKLESLYLFGSSVPSVKSYIFNGSPIASSTLLGYFGSIYVRESLLASFQAATNLSAYSSRFVGLTDAQIAALE